MNTHSSGALSHHSRDFALECIQLGMRIPLGRAGGQMGLSPGNGGLRIGLGFELLSDTGEDMKSHQTS